MTELKTRRYKRIGRHVWHSAQAPVSPVITSKVEGVSSPLMVRVPSDDRNPWRVATCSGDTTRPRVWEGTAGVEGKGGSSSFADTGKYQRGS